MSSPKIICIGEILIDLIANPGADLLAADTFAIREGGAPMNVAVGLARLGVPVAFCGVVGTDPFGERLRALLDREGVDTALLSATPDAATSLALAWRDERGDGRFQLLRMADALLGPDQISEDAIEGATAIVVGSVSLASTVSRRAIHHAVALAVEGGVPVVFDVNVRPSIWADREDFLTATAPVLAAATLVKLSLDDAEYLVESTDPTTVFARLREQTKGWIVTTDGSRGVYLPGPDDDLIHIPVFNVDAVDPTGAGDAFTAALVSRLAANGWAEPTHEDIRFAMAAGALATTRQGALTSLPSVTDVNTFLARQ